MSRVRRLTVSLAALGIVGLASAAVWYTLGPAQTSDPLQTLPATVTFTRDIAPIIYRNCSSCHRPEESAPFDLLTYADVQKHARQIVEVTQSGFMPPWLPEPNDPEFQGVRRLTDREKRLLKKWHDQGDRRGDPDELPPQPQWPGAWRLGTPDLVISLPEPYRLQAQGLDVYRNFVIPIQIAMEKYVEAVEFRPGNPVVHHAFLYLDPTPASRRRDQSDSEMGFGSMATPVQAEMPPGHFLSWQPGAAPIHAGEDLAWTLKPGTDLVLQAHMQTSGKPEMVQPQIGFYFCDQPGKRVPFRMCLSSLTLDIPPGADRYVVRDEFTLPAPVHLLAVLPHAHYLGKEMQGWAVLPDGTRKQLLHIPDWDFNWQGAYRYQEPVSLPQGTRLVMRYTYDNSTHNIQNPNHPPQRVLYGPQTTDEMAELWFQFLPHQPSDLSLLQQNYRQKTLRRFLDYGEFLVRKNPDDPQAHAELGRTLFVMEEFRKAEVHFVQALKLDSSLASPHYFLGLIARMRRQLTTARAHFESVLQITPDHAKAHGNLGMVLAELDQPELAEIQFRRALDLNPDDALAHDQLGVLLFNRGEQAQALSHFQQAVQLDPDNAAARRHLNKVTQVLGE